MRTEASVPEPCEVESPGVTNEEGLASGPAGVERPAEAELPSEHVDRPTEFARLEASVTERTPATAPVAERTPVAAVEQTRTTVPVWELLAAAVLGLVAVWAVLFVPPVLVVVLAALVALPLALVVVPWLVVIVATALVEREP